MGASDFNLFDRQLDVQLTHRVDDVGQLVGDDLHFIPQLRNGVHFFQVFDFDVADRADDLCPSAPVTV